MIAALVAALALCPAEAGETVRAESFRNTVEPVLTEYCVGCHNSESKKGGVVFDSEDSRQLLTDKELWHKTLKMLRAGMMPPKGKRRPSAEETAQIEKWIKYSAFGIDPRHPDPGHVTLRDSIARNTEIPYAI